MKTKTQIAANLILLALFFISGCKGNVSYAETKNGNSDLKMANLQSVVTDSIKVKTSNTKVTFIELGSVRCIPCQMMQPIMKSIEEKYPDQVKVVFHDVWTPEGQPFGQKYNIRVIPTQVFLDRNDKEFYRHEGFFPEEELVKILQSKGVK